MRVTLVAERTGRRSASSLSEGAIDQTGLAFQFAGLLEFLGSLWVFRVWTRSMGHPFWISSPSWRAFVREARSRSPLGRERSWSGIGY